MAWLERIPCKLEKVGYESGKAIEKIIKRMTARMGRPHVPTRNAQLVSDFNFVVLVELVEDDIVIRSHSLEMHK